MTSMPSLGGDLLCLCQNLFEQVNDPKDTEPLVATTIYGLPFSGLTIDVM